MQPLVPLRVIKLGGSLLRLADLRLRFHAWLKTQSPAHNLVVAGGGQAVDAIRELDATHRFTAEFSHWLCVDLMSVTATLAGELLDISQMVSTPDELNAFRVQQRLDSECLACIQPTAYYTRWIARQSECTLPESWECTSDSIAAWLACSLEAEQLVLLKSVGTEFAPNTALSSDAIKILAARGVVDTSFPKTCRPLNNIRIINLQNVPLVESHHHTPQFTRTIIE